MSKMYKVCSNLCRNVSNQVCSNVSCKVFCIFLLASSWQLHPKSLLNFTYLHNLFFKHPRALSTPSWCKLGFSGGLKWVHMTFCFLLAISYPLWWCVCKFVSSNLEEVFKHETEIQYFISYQFISYQLLAISY